MRNASNSRVLTLGETCVLLDPLGEGGAELGTVFQVRVSGAESNFGIALARLGVRVSWISRVAKDPFGELVIRSLAAQGLDLGYVSRDSDAYTGLAIKLRQGGSTSLRYYRRGSAASKLRLEDVSEDAFDGTRVVHLTGITMALSETSRSTLISVMERARDRGSMVTFDLNYRPLLWGTAKEARLAVEKVLAGADWVLCGEDEGRLLFGGKSPEALNERLHGAGAKRVVIRIGAAGTLVPTDAGMTRVPAFNVPEIADEIGAGDAFDAGFVFGLMQNWTARSCAVMGNLLASRAMTGTGDWETLPTLEEVRALLTTSEIGASAYPAELREWLIPVPLGTA